MIYEPQIFFGVGICDVISDHRMALNLYNVTTNRLQSGEERFDGLLLTLAQQLTASGEPGIDPILDTYFSFLRCVDFA